MKLLLFVYPILLAVTASAAPLSQSDSGHLLVEAYINEQGPFEVIIDTAATSTVLSRDLINRLDLSPTADGGITAHSATGMVRLDRFDVDKLQIGNTEIRNVRVSGQLSNNWPDIGRTPPAAILGVDIIGNYRVLFSESTGEFELLPADVDLSEQVAGWQSAPFTRSFGGLSFLSAEINGQQVDALLDTGASRMIMNERAATLVGYWPSDPRRGKDDKPIRGLDGRLIDADLVSDASVKWASIVVENLPVTIANLDVFRMLRMNGPAMLMGAPMFEGRDILIDYPESRLYLAPVSQ